MKTSKLFFNIIILFIALTSLSLSQFAKAGSSSPTYIWPFALTIIGSETWATGGASIADKGLAANAFNNPAGIYSSNISIYAEFEKQFDAKWMNSYELEGQLILPSFASITYAHLNWNLAIGYMRFYNFQTDFKSNIRTVYDPEGIYKHENQINVHTFFASSCYQFNENTSIGLTIGINYLANEYEFYDTIGEGNGYGAIFNFGFIHKFNNRLTVGITTKLITEIKYDVTFKLINSEFDTTNYYPISNRYSSIFPVILDFGLSYEAFSNIIFHGKLDIQMWPDNSTIGENLTNFHLGTEINIYEPISFRMGYYTAYNLDLYTLGKILDQNFLTFGFSWQLNPNIKVSTSLQDSHLFNNSDFEDYYGKDGEQFNQTHISVGILYSF
jgi:hypothetical protein